jgi:hypothetical protein
MMVLVHIWPFIAILLNVVLSKTLFIKSHVKQLMYFGAFYCLTNYVGTVQSGRPLYHFLPWTDYTSILIAGGLLIAGGAFYLATCHLVNSSKTCSLSKKLN